MSSAINGVLAGMAEQSKCQSADMKKVRVSPTNSQMVNKLGIAVAKDFERRYMNLVSCFEIKALYDAIGAEFRVEGMDEATRNNLTFATMFQATEQAFLRLLDRGALTPIHRFGLSKEAESELAEMERRCGVVRQATPATVSVTQTPAVLDLDAQIVSDWKMLPVRSIRAKCALDGAYKIAFDRLMVEGKLDTIATDHVVAPEDRRPES